MEEHLIFQKQTSETGLESCFLEHMAYKSFTIQSTALLVHSSIIVNKREWEVGELSVHGEKVSLWRLLIA